MAAAGSLTSARALLEAGVAEGEGHDAVEPDHKRRLPRGTYTIQVRARDAAGNLQAAAAKRTQRVS